MTTTVRKGAGRPAANQRRNRHAQTTPLPTSEAKATAKAAIDPAAQEPAEARTEYGRMTVPELRARLDTLTGGQAAKRLTKGQLLNYILEAERKAANAADIAASQAEQDAIAQSEDAPSGAYVPAVSATPTAPESMCDGAGGEPLEAKGAGKATKFSKEIAPAGWDIAVDSGETHEPARVRAVAKRGAEVLTVVWDGGVYNYEQSGHVIEDRTTKLRNVSHARQVAARTPDVAQAELARVGANKAWRPREAKTTTPKGKLPFNPAETPDADVIAAILGKHVVWVNRIANTEESGVASKSDRQWKITGEGADRVIQFTTENGFRAARLDKILRVSARPTRKRAVADAEEQPAEAQAA